MSPSPTLSLLRLPAADRCRRALRWSCLGVLTLLSAMAVWAGGPVVLGCTSFAVVSGSMTPAVNVGDVVVACPTPASRLSAGQVVVFHDRATGSVVSHRIRSISATGELTTRGDANRIDDPGRVSPRDVLGTARLRVPWIGLPHVWMAEGRWAAVVLSACCLLVATAGAIRTDRGNVLEPQDESSPVVSPDVREA